MATVLLIHDNELERSEIELLLRSIGHEVVGVLTGREDLIIGPKDTDNPYDVTLIYNLGLDDPHSRRSLETVVSILTSDAALRETRRSGRGSWGTGLWFGL
jgi:hypothetical protein